MIAMYGKDLGTPNTYGTHFKKKSINENSKYVCGAHPLKIDSLDNVSKIGI